MNHHLMTQSPVSQFVWHNNQRPSFSESTLDQTHPSTDSQLLYTDADDQATDSSAYSQFSSHESQVNHQHHGSYGSQSWSSHSLDNNFNRNAQNQMPNRFTYPSVAYQSEHLIQNSHTSQHRVSIYETEGLASPASVYSQSSPFDPQQTPCTPNEEPQYDQQQRNSPQHTFHSPNSLCTESTSAPTVVAPEFYVTKFSLTDCNSNYFTCINSSSSPDSGSSIHRLSEDEDRRRKRRERNKVAATKCRHKKKEHVLKLNIESENLQNCNSNLKAKLASLQSERDHLSDILNSHVPFCIMKLSCHAASEMNTSHSNHCGLHHHHHHDHHHALR